MWAWSRMAASLSSGVSITSFHPPRPPPEEPPPASNDGDGSGIEAAGGSKLIGRTGRKGGSSNPVVVTFVGSLQPFAPLGATISFEAHFVRPPAHQA